MPRIFSGWPLDVAVGSGGSKAHESFSVAPSATPSDGDASVAVSESDLQSHGPTLAALSEALGVLSATATDEFVGATAYETLVEQVAAAQSQLATAAQEGVPGWLVADGQHELKASTKAWLGQLSPQELAALAAAQGFSHPTLVGIDHDGGDAHPLVHWLDPAYPPESATKLKIQAKAEERYGLLASGETIGGLTLADVHTIEAALHWTPVTAAGLWEATPTEVVAASATLTDAIVAWQTAPSADKGGNLGAVLDAEKAVVTASCPELGQSLDALKASSRTAVDKALAVGVYGYHAKQALQPLLEAAVAEGELPTHVITLASTSEAVLLLRASTPAEERSHLLGEVRARAALMAKFGELKATHVPVLSNLAGPLSLPPLGDPNSHQAAVAFCTNAGEFFAAKAEITKWSHSVMGFAEMPQVAVGSYPGHVTTSFRAWAKHQKLSDLRAVATELGLADAAGATRSQIQNYIAGAWDPSHDQQSIATQLTAAKQLATKPKAAKSAGSSVAASTVSAAPTPVAKAVVTPSPTGKSFAAKHHALVESLKHHAASTEALPPRLPAAEVAGWSFVPAAAKALGGAHTKSCLKAPDGSMWMFKPDKTAKGARAHAEAAASQIFNRVGVPSVPVYARAIDGQVGSIQPLVAGTTTLAPGHQSWSQADIDAIVRYHVAAWAVGDHDGKADNILRTATGGLVPCDQGQAFKFMGQDKLSTAYHPNASFGAGPPVFHVAYKAAKTGTLAKGIHVRPEAALPVIKAFEAIPDTQYRAILHDTAHHGAKHKKVHWYEPMRAKACTRLGKTSVSAVEVAEEFLHHAVERKHSLRAAFAQFFAEEGFGGGTKLMKVA